MLFVYFAKRHILSVILDKIQIPRLWTANRNFQSLWMNLIYSEYWWRYVTFIGVSVVQVFQIKWLTKRPVQTHWSSALSTYFPSFLPPFFISLLLNNLIDKVRVLPYRFHLFLLCRSGERAKEGRDFRAFSKLTWSNSDTASHWLYKHVWHGKELKKEHIA